MSEAPESCLRCKGAMTRGFLLDGVQGGSIVSRWAPGQAKASFWSGTKTFHGDLVPVGAYRCASCGYLELYARQEFGAE